MKKYFLLFASFLILQSCIRGGSSEESTNANNLLAGNLYLNETDSPEESYQWIFFGEDGMVVRNPKHGVNPVNVEAERADNLSNIGMYVQGSDSISITWEDGKEEVWSYQLKDAKIAILNDLNVKQQQAIPADFNLTGKYAAKALNINFNKSASLLFYTDGSFTESLPGVTDANLYKGKYLIVGNTLTLNYLNGSQRQALIAAVEKADRKYLIINNASYPTDN